nr:unnamed protein product [Callosobruchus analis]
MEAQETFLDVFNGCLQTGCFPEEWKRVYLALILKKRKPDDLQSSYGTICLLDVAGKLLEHMIRERLLNHLTSRGDISSR